MTVTRLDRLARSTRDLLEIAEQIAGIGAGLRSLAEPSADTTTPAGRMVLTVFAGMAEFERSLIVDRTRAGRTAAQKRGVRFGRPAALTADQVEHARELLDDGRKTVGEVAALLGGLGPRRRLVRLSSDHTARRGAHDGEAESAGGKPTPYALHFGISLILCLRL